MEKKEMTFKKIVVLLARILALSILGFITMAVASVITPRPEYLKSIPPSTSSQAAGMLLFIRFVLALIFVFIIENTRISGFRLMALLFWVFFGVTTFVMQLETIVFGSAFPMLSTMDVLRMAFTALVSEVLFVPLAVVVMGKWKNNKYAMKPLFQKNFLVRISPLAIIYPMLYFFFGFFVAWQSSAVREFYATSTITSAQPLLTFIQIGRGFLWVLAGLPLFVMFEKRLHAVIASILCYALFPSISLLLPNTLMPEAVRLTHFVEISLSMAIFGMAAGWWMTRITTVAENTTIAHQHNI
jgi:hypothetical protein